MLQKLRKKLVFQDDDREESNISTEKPVLSKGTLWESFHYTCEKDVLTPSSGEVSNTFTSDLMAIILETDTSDETIHCESECLKSSPSWLLYPCDSQGIPHSNPASDCQTLKIPESAWKGFTPFERQFWQIKSQYYDCVVFFKKGKFYELYEKDADLAGRLFDLKISGDNSGGGGGNSRGMRMAGIPESGFEEWSKRFVREGYRVAKVDQVQSEKSKDLKVPNGTTIIHRELTAILSAGTLLDPSDILPTYCMALLEENNNGDTRFAAVLADISSGNTILFPDLTKDGLETVSIRYQPREVICHLNNNLSRNIITLLKGTLKQFEMIPINMKIEQELLSKLLDGYKLSNSIKLAFCGLLQYFRRCLLEEPFLKCINFVNKEFTSTFGNELSEPARLLLHESRRSNMSESCLIVDGQSLQHLDVLPDSLAVSNSASHSLWQVINRTVTPFGSRLLYQWLLYPSRDIIVINGRLMAVDLLDKERKFRQDLTSLLKTLPDLERLHARIKNANIKVGAFLNFLAALKRSLSFFQAYPEILGRLGAPPNVAQLLTSLLMTIEGTFSVVSDDIMPDANHPIYAALLRAETDVATSFETFLLQVKSHYSKGDATKIYYRDINEKMYQLELPLSLKPPAFEKDWKLMSKTSKVHRYYNGDIETLLKTLNKIRQEKRQFEETFFIDLGRRFMENDTTNGFVLQNAIGLLGLLDCLGALHKVKEMWQGLGVCCKPNFIEEEGMGSYFVAKDLLHPVLFASGKQVIPNDVSLGSSSLYRSKSHTDGNETTECHRPCLVLTGPNMGGKSTLLRSISLIVILAQLGSYVPAQSLSMSLFDRIFTRLGASDHLSLGQSTFQVELLETQKILKNVTGKSLVVMDELGRGTSTFDGMAIAATVLRTLLFSGGECAKIAADDESHKHSTRRDTPTILFATHYTGIASELFTRYPHLIQLGCMDAKVMTDDNTRTSAENPTDLENVNNSSSSGRRVVFLYKLKKGLAPGSWATLVAQLAGIPRSVIERAEEIQRKTNRAAQLAESTCLTSSIVSSRSIIWKVADIYDKLNAI